MVKIDFQKQYLFFLATSGAFAQLQPFPSVTSKDGFEAPLLTREGEEARVRREEEEEERRESWGGWGGGVLDCFSYKSGIADGSP